MSRDKQIEEMARTICNCYDSGVCEIDEKPCDLECGSVKNAKELYAKGYRKASEVAEEIFAEIERVAMSKIDADLSVAILDDSYYIQAIDELKKKYTEEGK